MITIIPFQILGLFLFSYCLGWSRVRVVAFAPDLVFHGRAKTHEHTTAWKYRGRNRRSQTLLISHERFWESGALSSWCHTVVAFSDLFLASSSSRLIWFSEFPHSRQGPPFSSFWSYCQSPSAAFLLQAWSSISHFGIVFWLWIRHLQTGPRSSSSRYHSPAYQGTKLFQEVARHRKQEI